MTTRNLISDDGQVRRYRVLNDAGEQIGTDTEPVAGTPGHNVGVITGKVVAALDTLEQADANWSTLTAAQKDAAQRLAVRVAAKLARLALGRLDGA